MITKRASLPQQKNEKSVTLNGSDGPYIIDDTLYRVNRNNKLIKRTDFDTDSLRVVADNKDRNSFYVPLKTKYEIPRSEYELPNKMVVISDIEGKYDAFSSFLFSNQVIDENHNWSYNDGHLVLVGDFVDRGKNVTQVLWLIYKLEFQAQQVGGQVHFVLGNHEVMNFQGDARYNRAKYIKVAQEISGESTPSEAIKYIYSDKSVLGKWLRTKNVVERIGGYLFVHAGLSPELLDLKLSLDDINLTVRNRFEEVDSKKNALTAFLYGLKGPFWYRGFLRAHTNYPKIEQEELESILKYYQADKVVVGHTLVDTISKDLGGKVIRIDVHHGTTKFSGDTMGLLIEDGIEYVVDDKGNKSLLN